MIILFTNHFVKYIATINTTVGRLYFQQTLEMTHTYTYPCPGPINGCILNKIQHQYNRITNTRCYNHYKLDGKTITYFPNIDNLMMNLRFVTHLSIHNITCIHNCIFGHNCKNQVNVV